MKNRTGSDAQSSATALCDEREAARVDLLPLKQILRQLDLKKDRQKEAPYNYLDKASCRPLKQ